MTTIEATPSTLPHRWAMLGGFAGEGSAEEWYTYTSGGMFRIVKQKGARLFRLYRNGEEIAKGSDPTALAETAQKRMRRVTVAEVLSEFARELDSNNKRLAEGIRKRFTDVLQSTDNPQGDPLNGLSWSGGAFEAAGELKVGRVIQYHVGEHGLSEQTLRWTAEYLADELRRRARFGNSHSTSATSNLAEECEMRGYSAQLEKVQRFLHWIESARTDAMIDAGDAP